MIGKKITIIGGDKRSLVLANLLSQDNNDVIVYGFDNLIYDFNYIEEKNLSSAINSSDVIIGPLPFVNEKMELNMPLFSQRVSLDELFSKISKKQILMGGKLGEDIYDLTIQYDISIVDYFEREEMKVLNAIPTAEGAIQIAMEQMPITLHNSNVLVLGYGRIGKILSKILHGMGANVYVAARNYADISWINTFGYNPIFAKDIGKHLPRMDVIFNTVPSNILDETMLKKVNNKSIIIDLASKPGGVDFNKAKEMNIKSIWALALPGKVAPITAALCMKKTIYNIIEELEV